jgi:FkbM family methyltransferase
MVEERRETTSLRTALKRAGTLRDEGDERLRQSREAYRQILAQMPHGHDRGQIVQRAWGVGQALGQHPLHYSQAGQDRFLDEQVFRGKRDGVFIEVGGYDGVTGSNCLFFEVARGWTGILIEPVEVHRRTAASLRRAVCIDAAVAGAEGVADFVHVVEGYTQMSGLAESYDAGLLKTVRKNSRHREALEQRPIRRLDSIFREHGIQRVDYCSLDVEGAELEILASFPFAELEVDAWTIENPSRGDEIRTLMERNGYRHLTVLGADEVYVHARLDAG